MLLERFDKVVVASDVTEVVLIEDAKALNIDGPKHLLVDNTLCHQNEFVYNDLGRYKC